MVSPHVSGLAPRRRGRAAGAFPRSRCRAPAQRATRLWLSRPTLPAERSTRTPSNRTDAGADQRFQRIRHGRWPRTAQPSASVDDTGWEFPLSTNFTSVFQLSQLAFAVMQPEAQPTDHPQGIDRCVVKRSPGSRLRSEQRRRRPTYQEPGHRVGVASKAGVSDAG